MPRGLNFCCFPFAFVLVWISICQHKLLFTIQSCPEVDCLRNCQLTVLISQSSTNESEDHVIKWWSWESVLTNQQSDSHKTLFNTPLENKRVLKFFFLFFDSFFFSVIWSLTKWDLVPWSEKNVITLAHANAISVFFKPILILCSLFLSLSV